MTVHAPALTPARRLRLLPGSRSLGWVPFAWLIYLANFFIAPITRGASAAQWIATVVATVVFLVSYFAGHWVRRGRLMAVIAVQVGLALAFAPFNPGAATFFVYAASFAGRIDRPRVGLRVILLIALTGVVAGLALSAPVYYWILVLLLAPLIGAVNWHYAQVTRADARLRMANEEIERLAALAERERIARDLHDVLGHTLTLIVLKAELASRLSDRDPSRAAREIREVEQISREALTGVREAITGYRASFEDELARARVILEAAGIRGEFVGTSQSPDRPIEEVLALAVREAITNVVRHARAKVCQVRWERAPDHCRLEVIDDGDGGALVEGNGMRGLRARVEALGGSVAWHDKNGMRLAITLPANLP